MSTKLVEVFTEKEEVKQLKDKIAYLEAAMAEKRGRTGDTTLYEETAQRRPRRGKRSVSPTRSHNSPQVARFLSPQTNPRVGVQETVTPPVTTLAPDWQSFVPDPHFEDPAV